MPDSSVDDSNVEGSPSKFMPFIDVRSCNQKSPACGEYLYILNLGSGLFMGY
jgi:hypothetical protein